VLDDILGVILLALLYEYSIGGGVSLRNTGKVVLFIAIFLLLAPVTAKFISRTIKRYDEISATPGLLPTTMVSLLLLFAWLAHKVGAPELLGGFAAGMAVSRYFFLPFATLLHADEPFAHRVEAQMKPIVHLFTPIFFVMVGLSLDLRTVDWGSAQVWLLFAFLFVAAVLGKLAAAFLMPGENRWTRIAVGLAMVPRGEVGLIFAELGRASGIFDNTIYAALLLVITLTTLLPPFLMRWFYSGPGRRLP
jgi:Kef-type K+ transport system membrane component KefB